LKHRPSWQVLDVGSIDDLEQARLVEKQHAGNLVSSEQSVSFDASQALSATYHMSIETIPGLIVNVAMIAAVRIAKLSR